jgi:hypothetical protein
MAGPAFDPNGAVRFDLRAGAATDARGARLVVLPAGALEALERAHPDAVAALGAETGKTCGARVAARLGGDTGVRAAQLEVVVSHLAGELAVAGLGAVHLERWGRAMVLVLANPSVASERFCGAVLAGALGAATGREVATAAIGKDAGGLRFFVGTRATSERVGKLVASGTPFAQALASLQGDRS